MMIFVSASDDMNLVVGQPCPKTPPLTVTPAKFRGPSVVIFAKPPVEPDGKASARAPFGEPGEYV
jgi:hypothetical protein